MATRKPVDLNAQAQAQRARQIQAGGYPDLAPNVTDTHAVGYAAGLAARRGLPKGGSPVAGGPPPAIPALEQPHQAGMTMAQQAAVTRRHDSASHAHAAVAAASPDSIIDSDVQQQAPPDPRMVAAPPDLALLPQDLLPQAATQDEHYRHGTGSRMAMSQPHMAAKYGVVRNGQHVPPQNLVRGQTSQQQQVRRPPAAVRQDFEQALKSTQQPSKPKIESEDAGPEPPEHLPRTDAEAEAQAKAGPGGSASKAGQPPVAPVFKDEELRKKISALDDLDYDALRREMIEDILKHPKQRETVESRCKPLSIEELILHNVVQQRVPIIPGKFEPTFENMRGDVELVLKRLLVKESKSVAVTEDYLLDKYAVMTTTAGVVAINGNPVPSMYDTNGDFSEDKYWEKFNWMLKRPIHMLASLGIHYSWFEIRVRKLFKVDEGKDG